MQRLVCHWREEEKAYTEFAESAEFTEKKKAAELIKKAPRVGRGRIIAEAWRLLELFLQLGELQLGLSERLHNEALGVFGSQIARGGHFTDQEILGAL